MFAIGLLAPLPGVAAATAGTLLEGDKKAYARAFSAAKSNEWLRAERLAARAREGLPRKALLWMRLTQKGHNIPFAKISAFVRAHPHWPKQRLMRQRVEEAMDKKTPESTVLAWYSASAPVSAEGAIRLIAALDDAGRTAEADALIRRTWIEYKMPRRIARKFHKKYRKRLTRQDHVDRLERLLWDRQTSAAYRQIFRVAKDRQALGAARLALIRSAPDVDAKVAKVPSHLADDQGLIYERLRWRRRHGKYITALEMLALQPEVPVEPAKWWRERRSLARRNLRKGYISRAYQLAAGHKQKLGLPLAEAEWLAGWIALRSLGDNAQAFKHFKRMFDAVQYPVSQARAAYWAGRAADAAGKFDIARQWYERASTHMTAFYGQLAAGHLAKAARPKLPPEPQPTPEQRKAFGEKELVRLVGMLVEIGLKKELNPFFRQLTREIEFPAQWTLTATLAEKIGRHDLAVYVAKKALPAGVVLGGAGYPALATNNFRRPEPALVHAVVRQESAFNPKAISRRGARGLMQLMPMTALKVAQRLNMPYSRSRLLVDPDYNIRLGRAYLAGLLSDFQGAMIPALAAYNAGPHRARRWIRKFGKPGPTTDVAVDWIESIPIYETRNYVQRVLENFTVYRGRRDDLDMALSLAENMAKPAPKAVP